MKTFTALPLLVCLAGAVANALPQSDGGVGDVTVFGPAPADPRDCRCQCSSLGFTDSYGVRQGNCNTARNGAKWCYVDQRNRRCPDLRYSRKYPGREWSTHACFTPAKTDPICTGFGK